MESESPAAASDEQPDAGASKQPETSPPTVRVQLNDGQWADMTTKLTARDFLTFHELEAIPKGDQQALVDAYPKVLALIDRHVVRHSFGSADILVSAEPMTLTELYIAWRTARREQAVPKPSGDS